MKLSFLNFLILFHFLPSASVGRRSLIFLPISFPRHSSFRTLISALGSLPCSFSQCSSLVLLLKDHKNWLTPSLLLKWLVTHMHQHCAPSALGCICFPFYAFPSRFYFFCPFKTMASSITICHSVPELRRNERQLQNLLKGSWYLQFFFSRKTINKTFNLKKKI